MFWTTILVMLLASVIAMFNAVVFHGFDLVSCFIAAVSGLEPKNLSRTLEDAATVIEPITPWTAAGVCMATTVGVSTLEYLPWACLNYTGVIFAFILGATGFLMKN